MLYRAFQAQTDLVTPVRFMAKLASDTLAMGPSWLRALPAISHMAAGWEMIERCHLTNERPPYGFGSVMVEGREAPVHEVAVASTPFGDLINFKKEGVGEQPRILLIAPLSGHFATLLRGTVATLLPENDVYITDWRNAREAPVEAGDFGFDDYVDHVIKFLEAIGPGAHLLGVCQPCAHALAAVSIMAEDDNPCTPLSMTLMAGPVDTRVNPTKVNDLAVANPISWFEKNLISTVPARYPGAGRRVYPGFVQLTAFMAMNPSRHIDAHIDMFTQLATGKFEEAQTGKTFYDEYFAVLDLTAEFYLETVNRVFQRHLLPRGELMWRGRKVNPAAIRRTTLFTVEGERDDICSVGQTVAAHQLCSGVRPNRKRHHLQPGVGHYGVFSGRKWTNQIYPLVRNVILSSS